MQASIAPATVRAYEATWRSLRDFIQRSPDVPLFPVTIADVADFIGSRFEAGGGSSALASHCSAIAYGHRIRGLPDPTADFRVRRMLAGARRLRPGGDSRAAITLSELDSLRIAVSNLALGAVEKAAFKAIFSLAFFAMLRPGELVVGSTSSHTIRVRHITVQGDRISITIPSSKTSAAPFTTVLIARSDLAACPVRAIREYMAVRPQSHSNDYLFVAGANRPITTRSLTRMVRRAGRIAQMDVARMSGHCFRIGGASYGARHGMSELQLCEAGRWSSSAVRRYLRRPVSLLEIATAD